MMTEELGIERKQLIEDWARFTEEHLQKSLIRKKVGHSGNLNNSFLYKLKAAGGDVQSVVHEFNFYGKFVDMGVGRGQKIESVKGNADLISLLGHGRRPKKWFSKTYYSQVLKLEELLAKKYGTDFQRVVKEYITGNFT